MAKWTDYPTKTTPADTDDLMIYDATGKANKRVLFSGLWNWIVDKLTNAVINNLQTNNKTILGALNELNSNTKAQINAGIMSGSIVIPIKKLQSMVLFCTGDNNATSFIAIRFDAKGIQGTALLSGDDRKFSYTYVDKQLTISAQDTSYYGRYIVIS